MHPENEETINNNQYDEEILLTTAYSRTICPDNGTGKI